MTNINNKSSNRTQTHAWGLPVPLGSLFNEQQNGNPANSKSKFWQTKSIPMAHELINDILDPLGMWYTVAQNIFDLHEK